jgi:transcription elongation factor Elf1
MTDLERKTKQEILRYAVQQSITCPTCGDVLDVQRAVATFIKSRAGVACAPCFDKSVDTVARKYDWTRDQTLEGIEVHDGRELFRRAA